MQSNPYLSNLPLLSSTVQCPHIRRAEERTKRIMWYGAAQPSACPYSGSRLGQAQKSTSYAAQQNYGGSKYRTWLEEQQGGKMTITSPSLVRNRRGPSTGTSQTSLDFTYRNGLTSLSRGISSARLSRKADVISRIPAPARHTSSTLSVCQLPRRPPTTDDRCRNPSMPCTPRRYRPSASTARSRQEMSTT